MPLVSLLSVPRPQASEAQESYVSLSDTCLLSTETEPQPPDSVNVCGVRVHTGSV